MTFPAIKALYFIVRHSRPLCRTLLNRGQRLGGNSLGDHRFDGELDQDWGNDRTSIPGDILGIQICR